MVRATTAPAPHVGRAFLRPRLVPTGLRAPRIGTRAVRFVLVRTTADRLAPVQIALVVRVRMVVRIVLVVRVRMVVRIVLVVRVRMVVRIVLVVRVQMVVRIALVVRARPAGSDVILVRTLASSAPVVQAPSGRPRAALVGRCPLPISARSLSRTSVGPSPSVSRLRLRRGNVSNGSMKARCARRPVRPPSALPPRMCPVAVRPEPSYHQR